MKFSEITKALIDEMSFIDLAYLYLSETGEPKSFYDLIAIFKQIGQYTDEEIATRTVQFYTTLNVDGRFVRIEDQAWALRDWLEVDEILVYTEPSVRRFDDEDEDIIFEDEEIFKDELDEISEAEEVDEDEEVETTYDEDEFSDSKSDILLKYIETSQEDNEF